MNRRIAVASSDGIVVNQHFGHAQQFLIFNIEGNNYSFDSLRKNVPPCNFREHSEQSLWDSVTLIIDCDVVVVAKIGSGALKRLAEEGITAISDADYIENVLQRVASLKDDYF